MDIATIRNFKADCYDRCRFSFVPVPTAAQRAAAANRDDPRPLPAHVDTAPVEQIAELGALAQCATCGYRARFHRDDAPADAAAAQG